MKQKLKRKTWLAIECHILLSCAWVISISNAFAFQDVLDTPAPKIPHAEKHLFNGIVSAGGRLISVGQYGIILYSDDKGKHWAQAVTPVSSDLTAVSFATPLKGWAVGHDGVVLHSTDAGETWVKQLDGRAFGQVMVDYYKKHPPVDRAGDAGAMKQFMAEVAMFASEGPDKPFLDVFFESDMTGFATGPFNLIFHTSDGGRNWVPWLDRTENPGALHMYSVRSISGEIYITGEQGMVLKLDRKAGRFRNLKTPYTGTFFGIAGKAGIVVAFGMRGNVFRSTDQGESWRKIKTGVEGGLTGAAVTADGRIIIVSQSGDILVGRNDCQIFDHVKMKIPFSAASVSTMGNNEIALAGFGGMRVEQLKETEF